MHSKESAARVAARPSRFTDEALLDNPIWNSLRTAHQAYAQIEGDARRYEPAIGPLSGTPDQSDGSYNAFGQKCTHLSCPVHYSPEHARLECPCHEGGFDERTGKVLYGPPPRPLDTIDLEMHNGEIFAVGREVRGAED